MNSSDSIPNCSPEKLDRIYAPVSNAYLKAKNLLIEAGCTYPELVRQCREFERDNGYNPLPKGIRIPDALYQEIIRAVLSDTSRYDAELSETDDGKPMIRTHTRRLAEVHEELQLCGDYDTVSTGSDCRANCWMVPSDYHPGAFYVERYGGGGGESHPCWKRSAKGRLYCVFNECPEIAEWQRQIAIRSGDGGRLYANRFF